MARFAGHEYGDIINTAGTCWRTWGWTDHRETLRDCHTDAFISWLSRHGLRIVLRPEIFIGYRVWMVRFEAILRCAVTGYSSRGSRVYHKALEVRWEIEMGYCSSCMTERYLWAPQGCSNWIKVHGRAIVIKC